jgi:EF hand
MRKLLLGLAALALISIAKYVTAQTTAQPSSTETTTSTTPPTTETEDGTKMRLAAMDTSAAAFRKLDADKDGRISALEAADNPRLAAAFTIADKDKDGYLSEEEFEAMGSSAQPDVHRDIDATSPDGDQRATGPNETNAASSSPPPRATPPKH